MSILPDSDDTERAVYKALTDEEAEDGSKRPGNFLKHVLSLTSTKTGDGLMDPKLVLAWLLTTLGTPAALLGWLVPLREAGSLLPQLFTAGWLRSRPQRKWAWAAGSVVQGVCVAAMAIAAWNLDGARAGWTIVGLLALFAIARSVCSVTYKDVLGRTLPKSTRGAATGAAASIAASLTLLYGALLSVGLLERSVTTIAAALLVAACLWIFAAAVFATLAEAPTSVEARGDVESGGELLAVTVSQFRLLRKDPQLVRFIATRGLLIATALAPPYLVALTGRQGERELGSLGPFVIASALASMGSGYVWGRLSDRSSRLVLAGAAAMACCVLVSAAALVVFRPSVFALEVAPPALLFLLMVAYQGVRLGRSTHLVDMAKDEDRAAYTALSNTVIGLLLMLGGLFGFLAQAAGEAFVLAVFGAMCAAAAGCALGLEEVQTTDS